MSEVGTYTVEDGGIGVVAIDHPPVNALGIVTRRAIDAGCRKFADDDAVKAIVLICGGRTFIAGADIAEFDHPPIAPTIHQLFDLIEAIDKPIVAAIHGTALGAGLELALICNYRIAVPSARVGLPEVSLGLLPGAGGTQRLPRIVGVERALELMISGAPVPATKALELGIIDVLAEEGGLREDAVALARTVIGKPAPRVRDRQDMVAPARGHPEIYADFLQKNARAFRGFKAPGNIVKAVEAAAEIEDFDAGMAREAELFAELLASPESAAQRYYFFAERETAKIPDIPRSTPTVAIDTVGVIGGGAMSGGIAMSFLDAGIAVTLVEASREALDRGLAVIREKYQNSAQKGRMTPAQVDRRLALITPALDLAALAEADLIVEAVVEEESAKKEVFARLDAVARPGAILASNTSFLDLDAIASATGRPDRVVGLHFFPPANVMRLVEVVRGARTSAEVVATAMALAKKLGKVPVLSRVCAGFIANRIMGERGRQADRLVLQGLTPHEIDRAIQDFGFAMGPFQMMDLVGLDVPGRGDTERTVAGDLVKADRLGQKRNGGYYDYDDQGAAMPSPVAARIIADVARARGIAAAGQVSSEQIVARLLYPVVNEGAKVLEEHVAIRASDIDVAAILGYNWPVFTGGPMFWADMIGLRKVVDGLAAQDIEPAKLLVDTAARGAAFTR
ncbi:3-hydroxyacyl-CoA dehydrogenase NAD-binding domain-containing protein [uncultured Sphingomonas sp.]|uniref:3-hydroxyacyl-CoA dehydrogenase NAD-binding domain-containing protein n=1 Tax=uncultured Sphingomonas sp. TaxID=158754 RepID=UPI0035CBDBDF